MAEEEIIDTIPPDWPEEFNAPVAKLGPPLSVHRFTQRIFRERLVYAIGGILLSGVLNYLYWFVFNIRFADKFIFLLLFGPLIFSIAMIGQILRHRGLWVLRFPMGLLCWKRGTIVSFPWDELQSISFKNYHGSTAAAPWYDAEHPQVQEWKVAVPLLKAAGQFQTMQMTILREDGEELTIPSSLENSASLGERIQAEVFSRKWPALWQQYQLGERLEFGELVVGPGGLSHKKDSLAWYECQSTLITSGTYSIFRVGRKRPWKMFPIASIPNPHILFWLIEKARLPNVSDSVEEE
ncbi:hypothetical protein KIH39_26105 [Telmatocola sphagniphila]|uniref:Uncharacterized protein n=1 Tax=Telmatocola sphagniphila TaxID=1123043 RepID=A0A8E6B6A6_9BACT|nr:DUF6585 family protein [Telmatocola sphagniphila]QVL32264.1 hypothetical protein KIH39_26105 [Telmatocola sphagniphila]